MRRRGFIKSIAAASFVPSLLTGASHASAQPKAERKTFPFDAPLFYLNGDTTKPCFLSDDKARNELGQESPLKIKACGEQMVANFLDWQLDAVIDPNLRIIRAANQDTWISSDSIFLPGKFFYYEGEQGQPTRFELKNQQPFAVNEYNVASRTEWLSPTKYVALDWLDDDGKPLSVEYKRTGQRLTDGWYASNKTFWASKPYVGTMYMAGDIQRRCYVSREGGKWTCKNEMGSVSPLEWEGPNVVRCMTPDTAIKGHWFDDGIAWDNTTTWTARPGGGAKDQRMEVSFEKLRCLLPRHGDKFDLGDVELTLMDQSDPPKGQPRAQAIEAVEGGLLIRGYWDYRPLNVHGRVSVRLDCAVVKGQIRIDRILPVEFDSTNFIVNQLKITGFSPEASKQVETELNKRLAPMFATPMGATFGRSLSAYFKHHKVAITLHDAN